MAENWVNDARNEARAAFDARFEVEVELGVLKEKQSKLAEQMKEAVRARDSAEAGLKTTEKQFEDICKQLHYNEINLVTEKQLAKSFGKPGKLSNWLRRQLRPRSRLLTRLG